MFNFIKKLLNKKDKKEFDNYSKKDEVQKLPIYYALEGETYLRLKYFKQAILNINKAIELESDNDMFYITRAIAYTRLGEYQLALNDINKALELNNNVEKTHLIKRDIINRMK